ncbi:MAG: YggS family pyridoxal phosphate enzyme, partial [Aquificaceae bacterium]
MSCERLDYVEEKILKACERAKRKREEVLLLGASKSVPAERLRDFFQCGLRVFGENRVQEFLKKWESLKDLPIDWHFIGRLQSNKVKYIIDKVSL